MRNDQMIFYSVSAPVEPQTHCCDLGQYSYSEYCPRSQQEDL